jgi:hypothetical protein
MADVDTPTVHVPSPPPGLAEPIAVDPPAHHAPELEDPSPTKRQRSYQQLKRVPDDEAPDTRGASGSGGPVPLLPLAGDEPPVPSSGEEDSEESTVPYDDAEYCDLYLDEHSAVWSQLDEGRRVCAVASSFSTPLLREEEVDVCQLRTPHCLLASSSDATEAAYAATRGKPRTRAQLNRARKEATTTDLRMYSKQFAQAKQLEYESWKGNEVFDLVDLRCTPCKNFVTGRWVLTVKRTRDGEFSKAKARWVLRGFQDKQPALDSVWLVK